MPNGHRGSAERWAELEAPLQAIDHVLEEFAVQHEMEITKNYHNWPSRTLSWGRPVQRQLSFYLHDEDHQTFGFRLTAWEDRGRERYWKVEVVRNDIDSRELSEIAAQMLELGCETTAKWGRDQLKYVGDIAPL